MNKFTSPIKQIKNLHVEIGYQCNLRCSMCYQKDYKQKLPNNIWQKKLLPLYPHIKNLTIQGGEVTVIKEAKELMQLAKSKNPHIKFGIMTNGLLFNDYWQEEFLNHGDLVNFSLNAVNKKTYSKIHKFSNYDKVWANLKELIEKRNKQKSPLKIYISFVIIPKNIKELPQFVELGKKLGVDLIRFFFDPAQLVTDKKLVIKQVTETFKLLDKYKDELQYEGLVTFYKYFCQHNKIDNKFKNRQENIKGKCTVPWDSAYIDHNGLVQFCCMSNLIIGDLRKQNIKDMWNNKKAQDFRKRMLKNDFSYCQSSCLDNQNPRQPFNLVNLKCYLIKFKYDFLASPKVAWQKTIRKLKQYFK